MESTRRFPQSLEIALRFPHSTQADGEGGWKNGKPEAGFHFSTARFSLSPKTKDSLGFQPRHCHLN
jgi:hypothetical protein